MTTKPSTHRTQRVTLQHIADYCGVTKGTVSLALRGHPSIGQATTARVVAAAKELGYNPAVHSAARRLALLRKNQKVLNRVIALFHVPGFYTKVGSFASEIFRGIVEGARQEGFGLLVDYLPEGRVDSPLLPIFERGDVDGAIIFGRSYTAPLLAARLRNTPGFEDHPIVMLFNAHDGCSSVSTDDRQGAYDAVQYLLSQGHRYIAQGIFPALSENATPAPADRIAGARQAMQDAGLDPDTHLRLIEIDSSWLDPNRLPAGRRIDYAPPQEDASSRNLLAMLREHPEITAVLGFNDSCAFRIWQTLANAGINVPSDVSVIGYDDTDPVLNENGENLLTTVQVPLFELGREAARLAVRQSLQTDPEITQVMLRAEMAVRASTSARP